MNEKKTGLEDFIERHRADFDAFEPRPDLWDDIEHQLAAPTAGPSAAPTDAPLRVLQLHPEAAENQPAATKSWLPRPGVAAAVGLLALAGLGALWNTSHQPATMWTRAAISPLISPSEAEEAAESTPAYFGPLPTASTAPEQRLVAAVQRMESYYSAQLGEQEGELRQLEAETATTSTPRADWQQELNNLDLTYRQLKAELYRHPEPDVVLEAMNRNLQIRLDILSQHTRTREQMQEYGAQALLIADNPSRKP